MSAEKPETQKETVANLLDLMDESIRSVLAEIRLLKAEVDKLLEPSKDEEKLG